MKFAWSGKNKILQICLCSIALAGVGGCGDEEPQKPGEGFYTYSGYRDWYRVPLKFPWQLMMIDDLDHAFLEKYDPTKLLTEYGATKTLASALTHLCVSEQFVLFLRDVNSEGGAAAGILIYEPENMQYFKSEKELLSFVKQHYPTVEIPHWESTEEYYNRMWKLLDLQRKKQQNTGH